MKVLVGALLCLIAVVAVLSICDPALAQDDEGWSGKVNDDSLRQFAPEQGYVADVATWRKLWEAWRPNDAVPQIDFEESLVLVGTVNGPNLVMMRPKVDEEGHLKFMVAGTKIGGPGFGYKLVEVTRDGLLTINGNPIKSRHDESIEVKVVGKLRTGIIAIGGETTGTTITAKGITWELDFGDDAISRETANQLNDKRVRVQGQLERRAGVEVDERWIVHVDRIEAVE